MLLTRSELWQCILLYCSPSGPALAPKVTVHPDGLSALTIDVTSSVYGRECVDLYRATAAVGGVTLPTRNQFVTDPTQATYRILFPGVDLCRDMLTSVTAVAVTNGMEGTMSLPVTTDNINRSRTYAWLYSYTQLLIAIWLFFEFTRLQNGVYPAFLIFESN